MRKRILSRVMAAALTCIMVVTLVPGEGNAAGEIEGVLRQENEIESVELEEEKEENSVENREEAIGEEWTEEGTFGAENLSEEMESEEEKIEQNPVEEETVTGIEEASEVRIEEELEEKMEAEIQTEEQNVDSYNMEETEVRDMETASFEEFADATAELIQESDTMNGTQEIETIAEQDTTYATKRLIVKSKGVSLDLSKVGAKTVISGPDSVSILQFSSEYLTELARQQIETWPEVEYCEVDSYNKIQTEGVPEVVDVLQSEIDTNNYLSWGIPVIKTDQYIPYIKNKLGERTDIIVAVVDSGVDTTHSFFQGKIAPGEYDYVNGDNQANDDNGHGTHVAGTVLDCMRGLNVKILPIKALDDNGYGCDINFAHGVKRAVNQGAKVINYSAGGVHNSYKEDAVKYAKKAGVNVVVASGNEGVSVERWGYCPAHIKDCIVVGSVDNTNKRVPTSNYGEKLDIVAPGKRILSIYPGERYAYMSGTSMASPHVAAVAAMFRLMYPSYTSGKIEVLIKQYKQDLGEKGKDIYYGYGIPDMSKAILKSPFTTVYRSTYSRVYEPGKTQKLDIKARTGLTYQSSNTAVARVNASGVVTLTGCGTAKITVSAAAGVGYYADSREITFKVVPKKQKLSSVTSTMAGSFTVSYAENAKGTGYQVRYATKSNFSDGVTVKVYQNNILTHTISNLPSGNLYYVKVRTYKAKNGVYYYGKYSDPKKIKIL